MTINMDQIASPGFSPRMATAALVVGSHTLFTIGDLVLNDRSSPECYWVDDPTGFETPDVLASAQQNVQEDNELPDPAFYGGRTMTLSGWIQAGSYTKILEMGRALLDSIISLEERPMLLSVAPGGLFTQPTVSISCRLVDKPSVSPKPQLDWMSGVLKAPFSFSMRASTDATFQSVEIHTATIVPDSTSLLGRMYPRVYPLTYDVTLDSSGYPVTTGTSNTVVVSNAGNWRSYPIITFYGLLEGAQLVNAANEHKIILSSDIAHGESLTIDTKTGRIIDQAGAPAASKVDTASDWLALMKGPNALSLMVTSFDSTGRVDISWKDTSV
jgi:hypothetical protein